MRKYDPIEVYKSHAQDIEKKLRLEQKKSESKRDPKLIQCLERELEDTLWWLDEWTSNK